MTRRRNSPSSNIDRNPHPTELTDADVAASSAVLPVITTADLLSISNPAPDPIKARTSFSVDGRSIMKRSAEAPWQIVYGRTRVGGDLVFITTDQGEVGEFFHVVVAVAAHRIKAVETLFLDGVPIPFDGSPTLGPSQWATGRYENLVFAGVNLGDINQTAQSDAVSQSSILFPGKWTVDHRGRGIAHVYLIIKNDPTLFRAFPEISFIIQGRDEIYDPRTGTTGYTDNAALCIADYWQNPDFGLNSDEDNETDLVTWKSAADICDQTIGLASGGTEKRYTMNGSFLTDEAPRDVFSKMLSTIGGEECVDTVQGKLRILPKAWRAPVITLDENDMRSSIRVQVKASRRDTKNAIRGTYIDSTNNFQVSDFPAVRNALYLEEDNGVENYIDVPYPFTIFSATAQRMAKIELEEARQPMIVSFVASFRSIILQVGDVIYLNYARFGWVNKTFRVTNHDLSLDSSGGVPVVGIPLVLRETAEGVYAWNNGEETTIDLSPNTFLPDPTNVQPVSNLTLDSGTLRLDIRSDGTIFSRIFASWTQTDPFVGVSGRHEIQYKKSADLEWRDAPSVPGTSTSAYILDVKDGTAYDVRVRSVNGLDFPSEWNTVFSHVVVGKTARPTQVSFLTVTTQPYGVFLSWPKIPDLDLKAYEIREGTNWTEATFINRTNATSLALNFRTAGHRTFLIKSIDTSENESQFATAASVDITGPSRPAGVFSIAGSTIVLDWDESTGQFAIDKYRVLRGSSFGSAEILVETKSTAYTLEVDWVDVERFYIVAIDVAGNESLPLELDPIVTAPGAVQNFRGDVWDNNALLKWDPPVAGTLPVRGYRIYRGDLFADAEFLGEVRGTFTTYFELIPGTYVYWVAPIDTADNLGPAFPFPAKISEPKDFVFIDDAQLTPEDFDTLSNVIRDSGLLVGPVNDTETWFDHFSSRGWNTIQDQLDAGYPYYAQPTVSDGFARETIDFGATVPTSLITLTYASQVIDGSVDIETKIEWSLDNATWFTDVGNSVLASNFRYVRITIFFNGTSDLSLAAVSDVRVRLYVKQSEEFGTAVSNASDPDGTYVEFATPFLDISKITITPESETPTSFAYNFKDIPNPTGFNVKIWDENGTRITKTFTYDAKGVR